MKAALRFSGGAVLALAACLASTAVSAEAQWHCSRLSQSVGQSGVPEDAAPDNFKLASMGQPSQSIGITLTDLIEVYEGKGVWVNGQRLNACFMPADSPLSVHALQSLGLNAASMQLQARKSAIVQSHLHRVTDEAAMHACIARNFPAVGYLRGEVRTEQVVPCF